MLLDLMNFLKIQQSQAMTMMMIMMTMIPPNLMSTETVMVVEMMMRTKLTKEAETILGMMAWFQEQVMLGRHLQQSPILFLFKQVR